MKFPFAIGDEVVYVRNVTPNGLSGDQLPKDDSDEWCFTFGEGGRNEVEVDFLLPKKSYFDYDGRTFFLTRVPNKQYKRGMCNDNTSIYELTPTGFKIFGLDLKLINAYTAKPAFQGFRMSAGGSYAVTPRMAVDTHGRLFVDMTRIGYVDVKNGTIVCNVDLFIPEVEKIIREHGQGVLRVVHSKKTPPNLAKMNAPADEPVAAILNEDFEEDEE